MIFRKSGFPLIFACLFVPCYVSFAQQKVVNYLSYADRAVSPGKTTYYIDPQNGDDQNRGTDAAQAWKTFNQLNHLLLSAGDQVQILSPGSFHESMAIIAKGTEVAPVSIQFAPGEYHFFPDKAVKAQLHISNTNDTPYAFKNIALMLDSSSYVKVLGNQSTLFFRGKMIETFIDRSDHIQIEGFNYDYYRPTVSELQVLSLSPHYADLQINASSTFQVKDSILTWMGEGWEDHPSSYWQVLNPETNKVSRLDIAPEGNKYVQQGPGHVRVYFDKNPGFKTGFIYQNRNVLRDCAGIFMRQSKNLSLNNLHIRFMHGMGVVSQYCNDISMQYIQVKPSKESGRTCAAWADILHFVGCSGKIEIANSYLSGANDDAINIHGVHLKIVERLDNKRIKVKFMHPQTYGFPAFAAGDSIDFIKAATLLPYAHNQVTSVQKLNDKESLLTLKAPLSTGFTVDDILENSTATPIINIHDDTITRIPTRGILVTSRKKTTIRHNQFLQTNMSAILINDDGSSWFESGMVRDVTIADNDFLQCGGPVLLVHPENTAEGTQPVHGTIRVFGNRFSLAGEQLLDAKSVSTLLVHGNTILDKGLAHNFNDLIHLTRCETVKIE